MRCKCCGGSKKMIGGGSIIEDCTLCADTEENTEELPEKKLIEVDKEEVTIDKRSKIYREAIKKIMIVDPTLSKKEAMELFDSTASQ